MEYHIDKKKPCTFFSSQFIQNKVTKVCLNIWVFCCLVGIFTLIHFYIEEKVNIATKQKK